MNTTPRLTTDDDDLAPRPCPGCMAGGDCHLAPFMSTVDALVGHVVRHGLRGAAPINQLLAVTAMLHPFRDAHFYSRPEDRPNVG